MKRISLITSILLVSISSFCQVIPINEPDHNKPKLFQGLPDNIPVSVYTLNSLFNFLPGQAIHINLSGTPLFQFEGEMVSITSKYGNSIQSVIFFSSNYTGARLTLSRFTDENGIIHYRGRILCLQNSDVYELQYLTGTYILLKRNLYDLVNE